MATIIRVRKNGPYLVEGDDGEGAGLGRERNTSSNGCPIALCRCGALHEQAVLRRHALEGRFQAAEAAVGPDAADKPAS